MTDIEFGELPPPVRRNGLPGAWVPVFEALRQRPGEWAKIRTLNVAATARVHSRNIRLGQYKGSVRGEFEATNRGAELWARYVGGTS